MIRWSCSTSISLVTRSLAGDKARDGLGKGAQSHGLDVMGVLGSRSRIQQKLSAAPPSILPYALAHILGISSPA